MAAVAPTPDNLEPPPSTPPNTATPPQATVTSTPPNQATPNPPASNPTMSSPNPNPALAPAPPVVLPPLPPVPVSFAPSFRPLGAPPSPQVQQYGAIRNPGYLMGQPMQPPGVHHVMRPPTMYAPQPGPYMQQPGVAVPPGVHRYPGPYTMMRPCFPPRPMPPVGVVQIQRPATIPGIRGAPPMVAPPARPPAPAVTPADKPPTAVYVGKIAPTVDNGLLLSLLRICGPVKSWKRTQNPSNGKPVAFGFCEFESAEGILRATRLLNKLSIDGQELVVNINDATKEYLKKHVEEKKKVHENTKKEEDEGGDGTSAVAENESLKLVSGKTDETEDSGDKDSEENTKKFGIVTNEDSEADKAAAELINSIIEEWLKTRPLPPPPPPPPVQPSADISSKHNNGESVVDMAMTDSEDNDDCVDKRTVSETEKTENDSLDRRKDKEHDKEKQEKEKELQRYERERERERVRRDRDKELKHREVERMYKDHLKEWESRERDKEYQRQYEKDREKEKERERKREIMKQEDESDEEDSRKRRRRSSNALEERKRRRQREKQEDFADKLKEEQEIAEARRHAIELQQQADEAAAAESAIFMEVDGDDGKEADAPNKPIVSDDDNVVSIANGVDADDGKTHKDCNGDEASMVPGQILDIKQNSNAPAKKLGFGLIGSGKRTSVPSVFAEEDDDDNKDKRIRPLVPIDYSTEELQAVEADSYSDQPNNIVAAAEFAKRILVSNQKEEQPETERSRRAIDRSTLRDKSRNDEDGARLGDDRREMMHDRDNDKPKLENKKVLDAKQLIDMIPRTKEELFSYDINWAIYEKHELHDRMRPWISKKIIEFLGEEESTLVEYIVSCTKDHVHASKMLELLQSILDVEAEMFVLKMWRMLIFEIKKVEAGLSVRGKA
ncbi:hypothetical protein CFC21_097902 [Triticum aestivum]|uniref:RNA-binding protein 25 n=3 Tax=Triticum TaxID=4564 RepID=A0A9R0ZEA9_TRITD|nr:RNA-binding protein 25-like [Triticum aestivum]KAF7095838.1 hypothetical protein CFC21_097902 [Triticum aestivum]VAI75255.1 unnamed protein product [Triticum turgidum subsp. durum]